MTQTLYKTDKTRKGSLPPYQRWLRGIQSTPPYFICLIYKVLNRISQFLYKCEIESQATIGAGLYIGHPYCITINAGAVIGRNCNIHKGLTIGQENRGSRKGVPKIGNEVWIGVNVTIVGNIEIGDDVLIAPNSYINKDVPPHSVVFGNPCQIKHKENATKGYINNKI